MDLVQTRIAQLEGGAKKRNNRTKKKTNNRKNMGLGRGGPLQSTRGSKKTQSNVLTSGIHYKPSDQEI